MSPKIPVLLAVLCSLPCLAQQTPAPAVFTPEAPRIPSRKFNLADFGGNADGKTLNTPAFAKAIEAASRAGGGTLEVGPGAYLTGPIELRSGVELHLDPGALIQFSPDKALYRNQGRRPRPMLVLSELHDAAITGQGRIDGHGEVWWDAARAMRDPVTGRQFNGTTPRPSLVSVSRCRRVRIEGVTLTSSPNLNLGIGASEDVAVVGVTILNPADSPNTDGIDPKGARRVLISRCRIDTGDDCIAGGGGGGQSEEDILIEDCLFLHGHGCSIGSGTTGGVSRFTVRRCRFEGTESGIRLKSNRGRGGEVTDLIYEDITMKGVGRAISINSHYEGTTVDNTGIGHVAAEQLSQTTPEWRRILIRNVVAEGGTRDAGLVVGLPEAPVRELRIEHVRIEAPEGLKMGYATDVTLSDVAIRAQRGPAVAQADTVQARTE